MKIFSYLLLSFFGAALSAQTKKTFDIVTYAPPAGWTEETNENMISYSIVNKTDNYWCQISVVKSTTSKGSIDLDFESEWQDLMVKNFKITEPPQVNEVQEAEGWKIKAGAGKFIFNNNNAMGMLTTMSGYDRCVSIVATANGQEYIKDIEALLSSVVLKKPETVSVPATTGPDDKNSVLGTWGANTSDNSDYRTKNGVMNYISRQYTFKTDGTYIFISKAFDPLMDKILLGKESGTYQIIDKSITITANKSVLEAWSKKDGEDKWGKLLNTQNIPLETVTYQFTKHYFSGVKIWSVVLQADKATHRDGPFSNNSLFKNAWYYAPISANNTAIELPGGQKTTTDIIKQEPVQQPSTINNTAILGTWCISASDQSGFSVKNGVMSTIFRQYTFKENGTYNCNIKTFDPLMNSIFLGRETGIYQINGNNLTINPQKNVLEEWSKKEGRDEWGKLIKTQNTTIEKVTYQFAKKYLTQFNEWQLVLQADKQTQRDGPFNNYEHNAWIYIISSPSHPVINLPNQ